MELKQDNKFPFLRCLINIEVSIHVSRFNYFKHKGFGPEALEILALLGGSLSRFLHLNQLKE